MIQKIVSFEIDKGAVTGDTGNVTAKDAFKVLKHATGSDPIDTDSIDRKATGIPTGEQAFSKNGKNFIGETI